MYQSKFLNSKQSVHIALLFLESETKEPFYLTAHVNDRFLPFPPKSKCFWWCDFFFALILAQITPPLNSQSSLSCSSFHQLILCNSHITNLHGQVTRLLAMTGEDWKERKWWFLDLHLWCRQLWVIGFSHEELPSLEFLQHDNILLSPDFIAAWWSSSLHSFFFLPLFCWNALFFSFRMLLGVLFVEMLCKMFCAGFFVFSF